MRIAIALTVRYPTEKAYGVSVSYTASELRNLGHQVCIYGNSEFQGIDENHNPVISIWTPIGAKFNAMGSAFGFQIAQVVLSLRFIQKVFLTARPDLIWTRSFILAFCARVFLPGKKVVIEVHDTRIRLDRMLYRLLAKDRLVFIGFVTNKNCEKFNSVIFSERNFVLHNAAPEEFFEIPRKSDVDKKTIGFVGKGQSNGQDNNLLILLHGISLLNQFEDKYQLVLIGLEKRYIELLDIERQRLGIPEHSVRFVKHIQHSELREELSKLDIGVIPYGDTDYNNERFPIKLIEYAAARVPILISDIQSHRDIAPEKVATFFRPTATHFATKVESLFENSVETTEKNENAYAWAKSFTYKNRVLRVIELTGITE
jgi:glycosyltransferase involved in cell wall biosynthesis